MSNIHSDLMRGNIETVILKCLFEGDKYGYDICKEIEERTHGQYKIKQPTLYGCLTRLENQGLVSFYWGESTKKGGRRKYFNLTEAGREHFVKKQSEWEYSRTVIDKLISENDYDLASAPPPINDEPVKKTKAAKKSDDDDEQKSDILAETEGTDNTEETDILQDVTQDEPDILAETEETDILQDVTQDEPDILAETEETDNTEETDILQDVTQDEPDILAETEGTDDAGETDILQSSVQDETDILTDDVQDNDFTVVNEFLNSDDDSDEIEEVDSLNILEQSHNADDSYENIEEISDILTHYDKILEDSTFKSDSQNLSESESDIKESLNNFEPSDYISPITIEDLESAKAKQEPESKIVYESKNFYSEFIGKALDESGFFTNQNNYSSSIKNQIHKSKEQKNYSDRNLYEDVGEEETLIFNEQLLSNQNSYNFSENENAVFKDDNDFYSPQNSLPQEPKNEDVVQPTVLFYTQNPTPQHKKDTAQSTYNLKTDPAEFMYFEEKPKNTDYKNVLSKLIKSPSDNNFNSNQNQYTAYNTIAIKHNENISSENKLRDNTKRLEEPVVKYHTKASAAESVDIYNSSEEGSFKVRKHSKTTAKEFNNKYYIFINKLRLWQFMIIAISSLVIVGGTFLVLYLGMNFREDAALYIIMGIGGVFCVPIASLALYFQNPAQTKRVDSEYASPSMIFIVIVFLIAVIICLNVIVTPNIFKNFEHITRIVLPSLMCLNIAVAEISYRVLHKSNKFNY